MDIQSIFNAGGVVVKNPNYTKKNKQPEYITVTDLDAGAKPEGSIVSDIAYNAAATGRQDIIDRNESKDKYFRAGLTPNDFTNLDEYLPETQSALTKWGNGIAQTVVSELALGIPKAFSDMVDVVGQALHISDGDYTNPVSRFFEEKQEEFRNFAPVHVDPTINILNGGLTDAGWWASNMPSIMSSLTLLLPGMAVVKPIQLAGKAFNIGAKTRGFLAAITGAANRVNKGETLNKFQRFVNSDATAKAFGLFLENGTTAAISRTVENYQEARQTYDDMYVQANEYFKDDKKYNDFLQRNGDKLKQENIDINDKDAVAKWVAKNAADETFKLDYANTAFDIIQLYALRNVWHGMRNAPNTSRKIQQANKAAASQIGKTSEEIAAMESSLSNFDKVVDKAKNFLVGSKTVLAAEWSEGVEEAVNYIAQQEGMSLGNTLLTGEGKHSGFWDKTFNGYDGRLMSYLNAPQLWDSAFWGVMGGVTFQGMGSVTHRAYNTFIQKAADKELNEVNKEKRPWYYLDQLPEVKRRIEDIRQRNISFQKYKAKLADIKEGIDVFAEKALQEKGQLNTEELKEAARKRAFEEYITDMTMSALNSGNYDLLKAYLQDENLRKGLINSGLFNIEGKTAAEIDAESKKFVDDAVNTMEKVANKYDEELMALHHIMIGKKFKGNVPAEVLGIIANDNIRFQQAIDQVNSNIASTNAEIDKEIKRIDSNPDGQKLDPAINYEGLVELSVYAQQLAILRKQRKEISKEKDSVSKRIALANIDTRIKSIESKLDATKLVYATAMSLMEMTNHEDGTVTFKSTEEFDEYYLNIVAGNPNLKPGEKPKFEKIDTELLNISSNALEILTDSNRHMYKVLEGDLKNMYANINKISPKLNELYYSKALFNIQKEQYESYIKRSNEAVGERIGEIMNILHGKRNEAIKRSSGIITDAYKKHGNVIRDIIKYNYSNNMNMYNDALSTLPANERTKIKDAINVLELSKTYNQNIAAKLEALFDEMDRVEVTEKAKAAKNGQSDNSIDSQTNTDTQQPNQTNPTQQPTNGTDVAINDSQSQSKPQQPAQQPNQPQPQTQSQQPTPAPTPIPQPTPAPTPQSPLANPNIIYDTVRIDNKSGYRLTSVHMLPNGDSYTIEDNSITIYNDPDFYDKGNTVLTRPFEVESKPIVVKENGKYKLVQKGTLVNTDTAEYQQRKATQAAQQGGQNGTQNGTEGTTQGGTQVQTDDKGIVLPTGERVAPRQPDSSNPFAPNTPVGTETSTIPNSPNSNVPNNDEAVDPSIPIQEQAYYALNKFMSSYIISNKAEAVSEDFKDKVRAAIEAEVTRQVAQGKDRAILESQLDRIFKTADSLINRLIKANAKKTLQSSTDELLIQTSIGIKEQDLFRADYVSAINELLDLYCDEFGVPDIDGKKYIDLESIFRHINNITNDSFTARLLYYGVTEYLNTDEARTKFVRTDELGSNKEEAIKNINKEEEERRKEIIEKKGLQRINLGVNESIKADVLPEEEIEESMERAFQNAKNGDEITFTKINNKLVFIDSNGDILGTNALPIIDRTTGIRTMRVKNFIYDVVRDRSGNTKSKLKDRIFRWFSADNNSCKELRSILYALTYDKLDNVKRKELIDRFYNLFEIKQAIKEGLILNDEQFESNKEATIKHLGNLLIFRNTNNMFDSRALEASLNMWFDKVYENYESTIYLSEHPDTKIQINNINDGTLVRISDKPTKETSLPVTEAIVGGVNSNVQRIAVTDANQTVNIAGAYNITLPYIPGSTHLAIPNRTGNYDFVIAFRAAINDDFIGDEAKEIVKAVKEQFINLYKEYITNPTPDNYNTFRNFVLDVLDKDNNSSLFYGVTAFAKNNILIIRYFDKNRQEYKLAFNPISNKITVTRPEYEPVNVNGKAYKQKTFEDLNDPTILDTFNFMFDKLEFNINPKLISSDSVDTDARVKGIVSKVNNKFVVSVGDQHWTYNSYNDFILSNNLIKVNTKPNESGTSNYQKQGTFRSAGYNIVRDETTDTTTPVENTQQTQTEPTAPITIPQGTTKTQKLLNILNGVDKSNHKGLSIFEIFIEGQDTRTSKNISTSEEEALKIVKELGLLPKNIIFDENFNKEKGHEEDNAKINPTTGQVTVGTKWLELWNNNRQYAIKVLIHEQIHDKIHKQGNQKYVDSIYDIFEEFKDSISRDSIKHFLEYVREKNGVPKDRINITEEEITKFLNQINTFLYEQYGNDKARIVEEFLVDSLMNGNLVEYLNSVQTKVNRKSGTTNLFQRILKALGELFGWNVEKGSLREKELYTLRKAIRKADNKETTPTAKPTKSTKKTKKEDDKKEKVNQPGLFDNISDIEEIVEKEKKPEEEPVQENSQTPEVIDISNMSDDDLELYIANISDDDLELDSLDEDTDEIDMSKDLKSTTSEISIDIKDNNRYSSTNELSVDSIAKDCQKFLDNFGIKINEYPITEIVDRFDKVNKVINANTPEEITDGVGEAIAFMMQHSIQFNELMSIKAINTPLKLKGVRRAIKNDLQYGLTYKFTQEERQKAIEEIGKDIAIELRNRYNINVTKESFTSSFMKKIKELIDMFFNLFTPNIKTQFDVINNNIKNIVNDVILNDPTSINFNNVKPGSFGKPSILVDFETALTENPYEENIISTLNKYDIALAGSASLAVFGTLYRPSENPMHDIDFNATGVSVAKLETILTKEFKNIYNTNTIIQGEGHTETYLILDRPFTVTQVKDVGNVIKDAKTGEVLGKYIFSNLTLAEGVKGKMLDFFLGNTSPYGNLTATLNGKEYTFTNPKNVLLAKSTWARPKDIFDYNRYVSNEEKEKLDNRKKENTERLIEKIKNSNIIWASPTIGKTTYIKNHQDEIIEWDEIVNPKRNEFIKNQIDPNGVLSKEEYNIRKQNYMANIEEHPEYIDFLTKEWISLKEKAKREHKKIFASPLPLLKLFPNDFDLVINSNENVFFKRNVARGGKEYSSRNWKNSINDVITNLDKDKVITTDLYFSDIMDETNNTVTEDSNIKYSSTNEISLGISSSVLDKRSQLPIQLRPNFDAAVASSNIITTMCR